MRYRRGFTLIEAALSLAILSIGLIGVMYAFKGMGTSSALADQTVIASNLARGGLEKIMAYRDAHGYNGAIAAIANGSFDQNPVPNYVPYSLDATSLEVDPDADVAAADDFLDASPGSGFARVTSAVSWNGGLNTLSLVMVIAEH